MARKTIKEKKKGRGGRVEKQRKKRRDKVEED